MLPIVFLVLNLVRYLWGLRVTTGARPPLALAALRVNLSLSWVIALACVRALTQGRGVFLRTPKFTGAASIRELRVVWVEAVVAAIGTGLLVLLLLHAGYSVAGLALAVLLGWSVLVYASAVGYALGDPARAPVLDVLRQKALLEMAPRFGRAARSRPALAAVALGAVAVAIGAAFALESGRPAVASLPFEQVPVGPIARQPFPSPGTGPAPAGSDADASPEPASGGPDASAASGGPSASPGGATPGASPAPRPTPPPTPRPPSTTPSPSPSPQPTGPGRTPPVLQPTPAPTVLPTPSHPAPSRPSPTPRGP